MIEVKCLKCGGTWQEPDNFDDNVFKEFARILRTSSTHEAMPYLQKNTGISPRGLKGICMHVTRVKGICHSCDAPLVNNKKTECTNCGSINYDW